MMPRGDGISTSQLFDRIIEKHQMKKQEILDKASKKESSN